MIHRIDSSLGTFKSMAFKPGLNILLADKSEGASDRQTRNSSGKSSLVQLIHFLLGGDCGKHSIFRSETLESSSFSMILDLLDQKVKVERSGGSKNRILVDTNDSNWPIQPKLDKKTGETHFKESEWNDVLGSAMFGIYEDEAYTPTFRSLFSYFVRREGSGGFAHADKQNEKQQLWDQQVNISHLLGLDWKIARSLHEVRRKEKALETLKREAKSGVLGSLVGRVGQLQTRLAVAESRTAELATELRGFQVLPEYRKLEQEASVAAVEISRLSNENTLDEERIKATESQLGDESHASQTDVEGMYAEANVLLPEHVKKQLADVKTFHDTILRNRIQHLQGEIDAATNRIRQRHNQMQKIDARRIEVIETLTSFGAVDQLNKLQLEQTRQQAEVEDLKKRLELARQVETSSTNLTIERAQLKQGFERDHNEHQDLLREAIVVFEEFSRQISDHEGSLTIDITDNGPQFSIEVEGGRSVGIRNMQIFCFDLTLAVLWSKQGKGSGFLIHDSHLFDGMDSRQIAKAIEMGAAQASEHKFQYIVTLNSDVLPVDEFSDGFDPFESVNPVRLSDENETGGLFGCRIV